MWTLQNDTVRRPVLDIDTACTIGTCFVHSRLDYTELSLLSPSSNAVNALDRAAVATPSPRSSSPGHILNFKSCTGSRYKNALNTKWFPPRISSSSLLVHVTCAISSQSRNLDPLDRLHWLLFSNHQLTPVTSLQIVFFRFAASLAEQASSYSSCFSVRSFIITQLFSILILSFWIACWPFLSRFSLSP